MATRTSAGSRSTRPIDIGPRPPSGDLAGWAFVGRVLPEILRRTTIEHVAESAAWCRAGN